MSARVSLTVRKRKWLVPLLALILLPGVAYAAERLLIPEDIDLPLYARGLGHSGLSAEDWIVTAFCYPPDSFDPNYDLFWQPVDPDLLPNEPCYLEGFAIFDGGVNPKQAVLSNVPGVRVPIWFTQKSEWTWPWTVNSMRAAQSLVGWADFFQDVQQPIDPLDPKGFWHHETVAIGVLEDGRSFFVHSKVVSIANYKVTVRFGK